MTVRDVESALANLASKADVEAGMAYDMAYRAAMARVFKSKGRRLQLARLAFAWVTFAKRPLRSKQLQHALAVDSHSTALDLPDVDHVLSLCAGLLVVVRTRRGTGSSMTVTLVHGTVHEYLVRTQPDWYPRVHFDIASSCMRYLSLNFGSPTESDFRLFDEHQVQLLRALGPPQDYIEMEARQWQLFGAALGRYALTWWIHHLKDALQAGLADFEVHELQRLGTEYFQKGGPFSLRKGWHLYWETPFHIVAREGLSLLWDGALQTSNTASETDSSRRTPLSYAAELGWTQIAANLLSLPAVQVDHQDGGTGFSPLIHAVMNKRVDIVRLLAPIAEVEATDNTNKTALAYIFEKRDWASGKHLFPYVDPVSVLKLAVSGSHTNIVTFLDQEFYRRKLARAKHADWQTLLSSALQTGSKKIIASLLSILGSEPDLCRTSLRKVYADVRAQMTYETAIKAQLGWQRLLPGQTVQTKLLAWGPDSDGKMELLKTSALFLAKELHHDPSGYRMLLQMKYSQLKRSLKNTLLPSDIRQIRESTLQTLEEEEPWLREVAKMPMAEGPWPRDDGCS